MADDEEDMDDEDLPPEEAPHQAHQDGGDRDSLLSSLFPSMGGGGRSSLTEPSEPSEAGSGRFGRSMTTMSMATTTAAAGPAPRAAWVYLRVCRGGREVRVCGRREVLSLVVPVGVVWYFVAKDLW